MLKTSIISDIHIHDWTEYSDIDESGRPSRLMLFEELARDFVKFTKDNNCDIIIVAGDISESSIQRPRVLSVIRNFFTILADQYPTYVIHGQHDIDCKEYSVAKNNSLLTSLSKDISNLHYISHEELVNVKGIDLLFKSWTRNHDLPEIESADVFVGHGIVLGSKNEEGYIFTSGFDKSDLINRYRLSIVGDIHKKQIIKNDDSDNKILIPGTSTQQTYKDAAETGFWTATITKDSPAELEFYDIHKLAPNKYHRFLFCNDIADIPEHHRNSKLVHYRVKTKKSKSSESSKNFQSTKVSTVDRIKDESAVIIKDSGINNPNTYVEKLNLLVEGIGNTSVSVIPKVSLKSIRCENFLSIKELDFSFDNFNRDCVILGNNGTGKTTVIEALFWSVTGETTKGVSADEVRNSEMTEDDKTVVELELFINDNHYKIRRERMLGKPYLYLSINNEGNWSTYDRSSVKKTQDEIFSLIGMDTSEIKLFSYFSSKGTVIFNQLTPAEKSKFISKLTGVDEVERLRTLSRDTQTRLKSEISRITGKTQAINQRLESDRSRLTTLEMSNTEVSDLKSLQESKSLLESKLVPLNKVINSIDYINLQSEFSELNSKKSELLRSKTTLESQKSIKMSELTNTKSDLIKVSKSNKCYTCHQELPKDSNVLTSLKGKVTNLLFEIKSIDPSCHDQGVVSLEESLSKIASQVSKYNQAQDEVRKIQSELNSVNNKISLSSKDNSELINHLTKSIVDQEQELQSINLELDEVESELEIFTYFYSKLFKREGDLINKLNKQVIELIQGELSTILNDSFVDIKIDVDFSVRAKFDEKFRSYLSLSNGQSRVVDVAMMVTLNNVFSIVNNISNGVLGICIFDEILSYLDERYIDLCRGLIDRVSTDKVVVMTHDQRIMNSFESKVLVSKDVYSKYEIIN